MAAFSGFPAGTRSVPVPAPLLGALLAEIDDAAELKCTLRFLWHLAQQRGQPRVVQASALLGDEVLLTALGSAEAVRQGLMAALARGTLLAAQGADGAVLLLNTPDGRRQAQGMGPAPELAAIAAGADKSTVGPREQANIFSLYEENIALLTPMVADELRDAEASYPAEWIEAAFREAVGQNKRSWRYIARILERWAQEGRGHGESGRHTETASAAEYLRRRRLPR